MEVQGIKVKGKFPNSWGGKFNNKSPKGIKTFLAPPKGSLLKLRNLGSF